MITLDQASFHQAAIHGTAPVLVMYTSPWCSYCKRLSPILTKLSRQYSPGITFGAVDIEAEPVLAQQEQIEVVPTLVLYRSGKALGSIVVPECSGQIEALLRDSLSAGT